MTHNRLLRMVVAMEVRAARARARRVGPSPEGRGRAAEGGALRQPAHRAPPPARGARPLAAPARPPSARPPARPPAPLTFAVPPRAARHPQSALADGRYDEAAKLRDEYRRAVTEGALQGKQNVAEGR
jgi:hypothetical protein